MGASLLAIAVYQSALLLADPPLSRAGSLPQGYVYLGQMGRRPAYNHPDRLKLAHNAVHPTVITPSTVK
ncbi:hypothetical protein FGE05_26005 [Pseudomonas sp. ICMP22404]|nr:hypothetical protein FGE05_26005 [Pseudomonas sp. ICMP22404]